MNLLKEEKKFWQRHFRIEKLEDIPKEWTGITGLGFEEDDDFFYFLSLRVLSILEIHLKQTLVTDEGIKHISKFKDLEILYLRNHHKITKESIPYFNEIKSLQSLNITKTKITLTDLCEGLNNQSLKEVFISSEDIEDIEEKAFLLKERMPNCNVYLDTSFKTDVFGNPIANILKQCCKSACILVMMPHIERSIFQWNWAYYPKNRKDEVSPWAEAFVNARKWLENK